MKKKQGKSGNKNKRGSSRKDARTIAKEAHFSKVKNRNGGSTTKTISRVLSFFSTHRDTYFSVDDVAKSMSIKGASERILIKHILHTLQEQGRLVQNNKAQFALLSSNSKTVQAIFHREGRENYAISELDGTVITLAQRHSLDARDGDTVDVVILSQRKGITRGEVVAILKHAKDTFVAVVRKLGKNNAILETNDKLLSGGMIKVPLEEQKLEVDDKVLVQIKDWYSSSGTYPQGHIISRFGKEGDNNTEMHAILAEFGLPYSYPKDADKAAEALSDSIPLEEFTKREDFRNITTFTIDPKDAKDFDDALSLQIIDENQIEVGVHIADVTYYVKQGDIIDEEAYNRATSIYLVDRTIAMLPEKLSNDLCSLRPNEDRLAYAVIFRMNKHTGEVIDFRIKRTVINSDRRFSYEEAQTRIDTNEGDFAEELSVLNNIAQKMRKKRFSNGGIRFESNELTFILNEQGVPLDVMPRTSGTANQLIEEFMLLANKTVATYIGKELKQKTQKEPPFVYRVHSNPDPDKLVSATSFLYKTHILKPKGKSSRGQDSITTQEVNDIFETTSGTPYENIVQMLLLRAMARAMYTTKNVGHFGLAFDYYTHFSSPIRRYPDMMVHRLVTNYLFDGKCGDDIDINKLEEACEHCSDMERVADLAERASVKYKQAEYLETKRGMVFDGFITGVTEWGVYITLNHNNCEGFVPIRDLNDDFYTFDENNYCLVGRRYRRKYTLGQSMRIRVKDIDKIKRLIDFEIVE